MKPPFVKSFKIDNLQVEIYPHREAMGKAAAFDISQEILRLTTEKEYLRMIFAAAPSQNEMLYELSRMPGINWSVITALHMDEYINLDPESAQSFANYLRKNIFGKVSFREVHYINSGALEESEICARYSNLLLEKAVDIVCMGIGENGHIAFNDPSVADFKDKEYVKVVKLDEACRIQQVNDGCFSTIDLVPLKAVTLTIPALLSGQSLFIVVPGKRKAIAIKRTLYGNISTECPASILRRHGNARLYIDLESAADLKLFALK